MKKRQIRKYGTRKEKTSHGWADPYAELSEVHPNILMMEFSCPGVLLPIIQHIHHYLPISQVSSSSTFTNLPLVRTAERVRCLSGQVWSWNQVHHQLSHLLQLIYYLLFSSCAALENRLREEALVYDQSRKIGRLWFPLILLLTLAGPCMVFILSVGSNL